jgi:hypothetical protein
MEKGTEKDSMTMTHDLPGFWLNGNDWRMTVLLVLLPALLAAGLREPSATDPALPESESYRTPIPDTIFETNRWRVPQQAERDWRLPPPPPVGWRTPQQSQSESSSSTRTIDIFPRYQPGKPSDFDMIEREEKPLIKMFEFGSK